jgi:flavorubredoxin
MEAVRVTDGIYWVGAIDWNVRNFHGYRTPRGSTYNAYLITGEKNILIDTVKRPFLEEMLSRIGSVLDPKKIDLIVSNHVEMDHSANLLAMQQLTGAKVLAMANQAGARPGTIRAARPRRRGYENRPLQPGGVVVGWDVELDLSMQGLRGRRPRRGAP